MSLQCFPFTSIFLHGPYVIIFSQFRVSTCRFISCANSELYAGKGGYITLADHPSMLALWLALIPPLFLSAFGLYMAIVLYKYGVNFTISIGTQLYIHTTRILLYVLPSINIIIYLSSTFACFTY